MDQDRLVRLESSHFAMGTIFSVVAYGSEAKLLQEAIDRAFQEIDRLENLMSHYKPDSELSRINREAARRPVPVTPELFELLESSLTYSRQTDGAFDITIGPLMKLWGFFSRCGRVPARSELAETLQRIGYRHVKLDPQARAIAFDRPSVELDLGAIGKGYAIDRAVATLRAQGIAQALVSSGSSSIYALGAPPREQGWEVSLCHPLDRRKQARSLRLRNLSISISGAHEQRFVLEGKMYGHLLDPRTAMPVENMLMTVVIAESNAASDALSTAFFVSGPDPSRAHLQDHPDLTALFYRSTTSLREFEEVLLTSSVNSPFADRFAAI